MTTSCSLIERVLSYLECKFEVKYTGKMAYETDDTIDYHKLTWYLNQQDQPAIMQGEFEDEDAFFEYVKKEIGVRRFHQVKYMIARHTDKKIT